MNKINVGILTGETSTWGRKNHCIQKRGKMTFQPAVNMDNSNWKEKNDQREGNCIKGLFQFNKIY